MATGDIKRNRRRMWDARHPHRGRSFGQRRAEFDHVRAVDGDRCRWCGRPVVFGSRGRYPSGSDATIDHVLPVALGGTRELSNLALCCVECNNLKGGMHPDEWMAIVRAARGAGARAKGGAA